MKKQKMKKHNKRNIKKNRKKLSNKYQSPIITTREKENKINSWFGGSYSDELLKMGQIQNLDSKQLERKHLLGEKVINSIVRNKELILKYFKSLMERGYHRDLSQTFQYKVLYPYFSIGNKYMDKFDEFYEFISKFNLSFNPDKHVTLFRCMDKEEYERMKNGGGVESPSFSSYPSYVTFLRSSSTLINLEKRNVFVCCGFNREDIISEIIITGESEVLVRKGSTPNFVFKYCEYGVENLEDDFGGDVKRFLPLTLSEYSNGFRYVESLEEKGWINPKEYTMNGNQFINKTLSEWSKGYYKNLVDVLEKVSLQFPNYISKSLKGGIEQYKEQLSKQDIKLEPNKNLNNTNIEEVSTLKMVG
jgi:hypothetical protein